MKIQLRYMYIFDLLAKDEASEWWYNSITAAALEIIVNFPSLHIVK